MIRAQVVPGNLNISYCNGCDTHTITLGDIQLLSGEYCHGLGTVWALACAVGCKVTKSEVDSCPHDG